MLFKKTVSSVYDTEVFRTLLKDVLHPGGIDLTRRVAEIAHAGQGLMVLDIGCGEGAGCLLFCGAYGCNVVGIDLSEKKIASSRGNADAAGLSGKACFMVSDSEHLPFQAACFDIVVSECAFSILPDKKRAAEEISRVLKPRGRVVITDVILKAEGVREMETDAPGHDDAALIPCLSGAASLEEYTSIFEKAGLHRTVSEDCSVALRRIGYQMALKFGDWGNFLCRLSAQIPRQIAGSDRVKTDSCSLDRYRSILSRATLGYALIGMEKPA